MINNRWKRKNTSELQQGSISLALKAAITIALITSLAVTSTSAAGFKRQHRVKRQLPTSPTTTTTVLPPKTSAIKWKPQVFVVLRNEKLNVSLFTVTSSLNTNVNLNFKFSNSSSVASSLFSIRPDAGIVSKKTEFPSSVFEVHFEVEASSSGVVETIYPVTVQIVSRGPDDRIFTNRPYPMWTVIDIWTRPYTVIQTLQSVDVALYGATDVTYVMEQATGDGGSSFAVDALSGDVYVTGRHQFINNSLYSLLISARSSAAKVAASASSTPSLASTFAQVLNVQVGIRNPQFFENPYNITFLESSTPDSVIGKIEAKSFQNLPITISISPSLTDHPIFSFNPATNEVRLKKSLSYLTDVRGYFFTATASEQYTNFGAITQVAFTLLPVNHAPEFAVAHYVRYDVPESTLVGTELLKMSVRDYDPGALGFLTFNCSVDTFRAEMAPDGMVSLKVNKPLDFESIVGQRYTLQVLAVDGGVPALTGSTEVQIWVTNTNNKAPVFEPANQQVTIQEGAAAGLVVYYVQAYDPDGDDLTFNLIGVQSQVSLPTSYFNLDPSSGKITLSNDIVPGNNDIASFILTISITDTGSCCQKPGQTHTVTGTVVVNVFRVNTQPTFKECKIYQPTVVEDASADLNTSILNMTATDNDSGPNGELEYRIFGEEKNFFLVRESKTLPKTAELYLQQSISRSSTNLYKFNDTFKLPVVVKVQDKGNPRLSTNCFLFVTIQTINKKAPVFDYQEQNAYYYTPLSQPGDNILRVFAFDEDFGLNGEIYYYFDTTYTGLNSNLCGDSVSVDRNSGWITWSGGDLSPKIITCSVIASDKGRPPLTSQPTFITIELFASNDFIPPKWDKLNGVEIDNAFVEVPENTAANQPFLSLKATLYNDTTIDYFIPTESISVLNGDHSFDIRKNSTWMSIIVATPLKESNQMPFYYLRCRAFITSKRDATQKIVTIARLKVNIKDVNNQAPRFLGMDSNGGYPASVTQYSKNGDFVAFVTAIDSDKDWPNNKVTYSLLNTTDSSLFSIDSTTGEIKVNSFQTGGQPIFNPDVKKVYSLTVIATDGAPSTINGPLPNNATVQVQIIVNGGKADSLFFSQNFSTNLSESVTRNSTVLLATVAPSTTPLNKVHTPQYNIQGGNVGRKFAVDNNTGRIYTVGELDAMKISTYNLLLVAFDGIRNNQPAYVSVTLLSDQNRRPPTFSADEYLYSKNDVIEKDSQSVNKVIVQIQAISPSNNQPITYSSSQPDNFVVSSSGQVSIARPLSRDPPNGFSPQQVNVIADNGLTRGYSVVTFPLIDINDNTPLFDLCCVAGRVNEKMPSNTSVMTLKANDADSGRNAEVDFSLVDPSDYFSVRPDGQIVTRVSLTMEKQKHTLKVRVTDRGAPSRSSETLVDIYVDEVSDFVPSFPLQSYQDTIPEKLPVGSLATSVSVTDRDMLDTVSYTLMDKPGSQDAAFFYVDSLQVFDGLYSDNNAKRYSSASIKISKIIDFDSNRKSTYSFILSAQDSAQRSTTTQVTIAVRDINDHAPEFFPQSKNVSISELDPVGKSVTTFAATDADSGDNAKFAYSIDYENTDPKFNFQIDSSTGAVTIRSKLDYEWRSSMKVNILAIDLGTPAQTGTATMFVTVTNEVDSPPVIKFNSSPYSNSNNIQDAPIVVRSNLQRSQQVSCLNAIDPDSNSINGLNFDLVCTNPNQRCSDFTIGNDGCLRANRDGYSRPNLGFDSYNIPVKVTKSGTQSTTQNVKLLIEGTDSVQPTNGAKHTDVMNFVGENGAFSSIPLGNVFISDPDAWDINKDTFTIQNPNTYFSMDPNKKGQILLRGDAPPGQHTATVNVKKPPFSDVTGTITATLTHVNESALSRASSLRLAGLNDARDLLKKPPNNDKQTRLQILSDNIARLIGPTAKVQILSMWDVENVSQPLVDVLFAAYGSPYYYPEKLAAIVNANKENLQQSANVLITMSPVDLCRSEFYNCWQDGCATQLQRDETKQRIVNTNETSFVGLYAKFVQSCSCSATNNNLININNNNINSNQIRCRSDSCLNGGICVANNTAISCLCPPGFDGRRCQMTKVSFTGPGAYLVLPSINACENDHIGLEILLPSSSPSTCMLLYVGPMQQSPPATTTTISSYNDLATSSSLPKDFLLLELLDGRPNLRLNLGDAEVELTFRNTKLPSLADGNWHSIDVYKTGMDVKMIVDKCETAPIVEDMTSSTLDASSCEVRSTFPGERFLLNPGGPIQLGGRYDAANNYPNNWMKGAFRGCVRNLQQNGKIFDLNISNSTLYNNAQNGCTQEDCSKCSSNSSCVIQGIPGTPVCQCPPGYRGSNCNIATSVKYFTSNQYVQWKPTAAYASSLNSSANWYSDSLQMLFKTRKSDGVLFMAESFTGYERYLLRVRAGMLSFTYDLGSDDRDLTLSNIKVDDGVWHFVRIERYGNVVELRLDSGDGMRYSSSTPASEHRYLKMSTANVLGDLNYNQYSKQTAVNNNLEKTCISDVRFSGHLLPLSNEENTESLVTMTMVGGSDVGCSITGACVDGLNCPTDQICVDLWMKSECRCKQFWVANDPSHQNSICVAKSCSDSPCMNGGTCVILDGKVLCICSAEWGGLYCTDNGPKEEETKNNTERNFNLVAAIVIPIIVGLLLLLLLLFLIYWCCCRRKEDRLLYGEPDKEIRENVIAYDDEGAGEQDNYAFDLGKLQKSSTPLEVDTLKKTPNLETLPAYSTRGAAVPGKGLPGDYPSIADFISDRLNTVDGDPDNTGDDSKVNFECEGQGSDAGSLSSLASSEADRDIDFDWLERAGPHFARLADLYGDGGQV